MMTEAKQNDQVRRLLKAELDGIAARLDGGAKASAAAIDGGNFLDAAQGRRASGAGVAHHVPTDGAGSGPAGRIGACERRRVWHLLGVRRGDSAPAAARRQRATGMNRGPMFLCC